MSILLSRTVSTLQIYLWGTGIEGREEKGAERGLSLALLVHPAWRELHRATRMAKEQERGHPLLEPVVSPPCDRRRTCIKKWK